MTEKSAEHFIPGEDELDTEQSVINFNVNDANIAKAKEEFKDVDAYKDMDAAKKAKKVLTKMRTTLAEEHKKEKAEALAHGRRLDAEKNRLLVLIAEVEDPISKQITDIKNAEAMKEEDRKAAISAHMDRLGSYAADRHDLNIEQIKEHRANLAKEPLTEEIYQEFLAEAKMVHEEADTKLRIVLQREEEAEDEREKLRKGAEDQAAQQRKLDEQQAGLEAQAEAQRREQEKKDAAARAEQKEKDDARQKELDKQAKEQAAAQKVINDENVRIAQEQADKEAAELKAQADADAEEKRRAAAPDVDKLESLAKALEAIRDTRTTMQTEAGSYAMIQASDDLTATVATIRRLIEEMK